MTLALAAVAAAAALAAYLWYFVPFPFLELKRAGEPVPHRPARSLLGALFQRRPTWLVARARGERLAALFREPRVRPLAANRDLNAYYGLRYPTQPLETDDEHVAIVFRSPIHLVLLPLRWPVEQLLCPVVACAVVVVYLAIIGVAFCLAAITRLRHRGVRLDPAERRSREQAFDAYLRHLCPIDTSLPLSIFAEPGYFMFKLAEGYAFREALARLGVHHPNCVIGADNGYISHVHLEAVDYVDVGTNSSYWVMTYPGFHRELRLGYLEDDLFEPESFEQIYMIHIVDHINDLGGAFKPLTRALRPGGQVLFSGLSHDFRGWWVESACAGNTVWNNCDLDWYRRFVAEHGLAVESAGYCQGPPSSLIWKMTYGFSIKTTAWRTLQRWLEQSESRRRMLERLLRRLWLHLFLLDGVLTRKADRGLNFFMVATKTAAG